VTPPARTVHVLTLNVGSSSLKYDLALVTKERVGARHVSGNISALGPRAVVSEALAGCAPESRRANIATLEHAVVLACLRAATVAHDLSLPIDAVAHRIVHGGTRYSEPTRLGPRELRDLERLAEFAPLHQPQALLAVRVAARALSPRLPQIGVFDTAFHATMPESAWRYPIPRALADRHGLRRFGFHGIAFESVMRRLPALAKRPRSRLRAILLHLGSGCSACAVRDGASVDTTMGLTPLDGLMMRTRSGAVDPALPHHLARTTKLRSDEVVEMLAAHSGIAGIAGHDGDVRSLITRERSDPAARLALAMFVSRIQKQLGAYLASLQGVDAIAFSGGIGENSAVVRERVLDGLQPLGIDLDRRANARAEDGDRITKRTSRVHAFVVGANEAEVLATSAERAIR
jgi:acetate kinase